MLARSRAMKKCADRGYVGSNVFLFAPTYKKETNDNAMNKTKEISSSRRLISWGNEYSEIEL